MVYSTSPLCKTSISKDFFHSFPFSILILNRQHICWSKTSINNFCNLAIGKRWNALETNVSLILSSLLTQCNACLYLFITLLVQIKYIHSAHAAHHVNLCIWHLWSNLNQLHYISCCSERSRYQASVWRLAIYERNTILCREGRQSHTQTQHTRQGWENTLPPENHIHLITPSTWTHKG